MKWYFQQLFESIWNAFRLFVVVCVSMQSQDILFSIKCQETCASKHILYYYCPNISFSSFVALYKFCVKTIARNIIFSFCMQYQDLLFVCNIKTYFLYAISRPVCWKHALKQNLEVSYGSPIRCSKSCVFFFDGNLKTWFLGNNVKTSLLSECIQSN